MIQTIGLIISVYAIARIVQVPLEMGATQGGWVALPYKVRFFAVVAGAIGGKDESAMRTLWHAIFPKHSSVLSVQRAMCSFHTICPDPVREWRCEQGVRAMLWRNHHLSNSSP